VHLDILLTGTNAGRRAPHLAAAPSALVHESENQDDREARQRICPTGWRGLYPREWRRCRRAAEAEGEAMSDSNGPDVYSNSDAAIDGLKPQWRGGCVAVAIVPSIGPGKGNTIISTMLRSDFQEIVHKATSAEVNRILPILRASVRAALLGPSHHNQRFLNDIVILGAFWLRHGKRAIEDMGIGEIGFSIDPDNSLPWQQRGMFAQDFLKKFAAASHQATEQ
jgi:hypothetical protein